MAKQPKLCSYIDMPLQHASGQVLSRMRRGGNSEQYMKLIGKIRDRVPDTAIRTTFIVGYPGESDSDFNELMDFVRQIEFERIGVFLYSDEEATAGFDHNPKVPHAAKVERRRKLMTLQAEISRKKNQRLIGEQMKVLIDTADTKKATGRLYSQAPEIDGIVKIKTDFAASGDFLNVTVTGAGEYDLNASTLL
jgi:ribosomal protein S12 methylthiotransferase